MGTALPNGGPAVFLKVPADYLGEFASTRLQREAAVAAGRAALAGGGAGLVLCHSDTEDQDGAGHKLAVDTIADVYRDNEGRLMLIGSGGIASGRDALELIEAGATVVQISSQLLTEGPQVCRRLKNEMAHALVNGSYVQLQDVVGAMHRKKKGKKRNVWRDKGREA